VKHALVAVACAGCLGPQVSDEIGGADGILPAGSTVPDATGALAARIAANDQVDGSVPRLSAFADGKPAHVWDLGTAPDFATPVFVLVRETGPGQYVRLDHPPILDSIPGAPTYSPFASLFYVEVTDRYQGELLTSAYAVQEAVDGGLVMAPFVAKHGVHMPVVAADVTLDAGGGTTVAPNGRAYYKGAQVACFDFGDLALPDGVHVAELPRYVLHRDGEEPLSEPLRHVDMDGDGDTLDTNDVYALAPADAGYTPRRRTIEVSIAPGTSSIDTTRDETMAAIDDATQLFDPDPVAGTVLAFDSTDDVRDLPQQSTPGGL
jgi:hypothetical protein